VQLGAFLSPLPIEYHRQTVDDHIQKAAHEQPEHQAGTDKPTGRGGQQLEYGHSCVSRMKTPRRRAASSVCLNAVRRQTTEPSLKIGRYIAITRPPTSTPSTAMISGSNRLDMESTALSTSAS